jgi:predicted transcriptional regulator of viral defense system
METKKEIENLPFLSKTTLVNFLNKNPNTLRNSIGYWISKNSLIRLKRGFFVFKSFLEKKDNSLYYSKFLATKMIEPSYLSKESVLQDYQMLTDVVFGYSVVTTKKTNSITNNFGTFNYQSIKKNLFKGFSVKSYGSMKWYVASKAKALFDYLYFNQNKFNQINENELLGLRLNLEEMNKEDWKEFEKYLSEAPKKMLDIYKVTKKYVNK